MFLPPIISPALLLVAIALYNWIPQSWFTGWVRIAWYAAAYFPVGITHPVATAIHQYVGAVNTAIQLNNTEEIAGHGLKAKVNGKELLVGNFKLMDKFSIPYHIDPSTIVYTLIAIAYDKKFAGYLTITDSIKEDAQEAVNKLHSMNVKTTMLSGDKSGVVKFVADKLGIDNAFGDLLPEDKVNKVKAIKDRNETVAFVGDGVNVRR